MTKEIRLGHWDFAMPFFYFTEQNLFSLHFSLCFPQAGEVQEQFP